MKFYVLFLVVFLVFAVCAVLPAEAATRVTETVDSSGDVGMYSSLALDSSNNPHVSYYDYTDGDLRYAFWNGSVWVFSTVDSSGDVGRYSSLALDSSDFAHISYIESTDGDLRYAFWNGSVWTTSTVDATGYVGRYSSLALDSNNNPRISYYDQTNGDLKYAEWDSLVWTTSTVDASGIVGMYSSLVLDGDGNPHISYYDYTNGDLKYAAVVVPLSVPLGLQAVAGDGEVELSWNAPSSDGGSAVTGYNIYRGNASGSETFLVAVGDVLNYTDVSVVNDQTYYYQVSAVNLDGEGVLSDEVSATPVIPELSEVLLLLSLASATSLFVITRKLKCAPHQ